MSKILTAVGWVIFVGLVMFGYLAAFLSLDDNSDSSSTQYSTTSPLSLEAYDEEQQEKNVNAILSPQKENVTQEQLKNRINMENMKETQRMWDERDAYVNKLADQQIERMLLKPVQAPIPRLKPIDTRQLDIDICINSVNTSMNGYSEFVKAIERQNCVLRYSSQ
ncbi:MAG: hypothetical protein ACD_81C00189G0005 [uncultured bacterium]|nr:MAG: hypothetical protein ACD_81C00189G0005 [uncultured bacterium]